MSELGKQILKAINTAIMENDRGTIVRYVPNVKEIRVNLGNTQKEFCERFNINIETLRAWEQKKRTPDSISAAYLACIAAKPEMIEQILHP